MDRPKSVMSGYMAIIIGYILMDVIIVDVMSPLDSFKLCGFLFRFSSGLKDAESSTGETFSITPMSFRRNESDARYEDLCAQLETGQFSAVVDLAWGGWIKGRKTAAELGLPYIRYVSLRRSGDAVGTADAGEKGHEPNTTTPGSAMNGITEVLYRHHQCDIADHTGRRAYVS